MNRDMNTSTEGWENDYEQCGEDILLEIQYGLDPA